MENEWAIILAGGDGTRLRSLTRRIAGDERPKQFCRILGGETLLEQTRRRIGLAVAPERTLYVVNGAHQRFYSSLLPDVLTANLVVQARNRGTTPAILYGLLRTAAVDPKALVAFFPSDHYISDDEKFMDHIRAAFAAVRLRPGTVILLGIYPESPEVEYGWIEPGQRILFTASSRIFGVRRFWEKPHYALAQLLILQGCLWNSFVMVSSAEAFLQIIESAQPDIFRAFDCLGPMLGTRKEPKAADFLYEQLAESNFSHEVLALCPDRLAVMEVAGIKWNDLGEPRRVMASLHWAGIQPHWATHSVMETA